MHGCIHNCVMDSNRDGALHVVEYKQRYIYGHNKNHEGQEVALWKRWRAVDSIYVKEPLAAGTRSEFGREINAAVTALLIKCREEKLFIRFSWQGHWLLFMNLFKASLAVNLHRPRGKCQQSWHCLTSVNPKRVEDHGFSSYRERDTHGAGHHQTHTNTVTEKVTPAQELTACSPFTSAFSYPIPCDAVHLDSSRVRSQSCKYGCKQTT